MPRILRTAGAAWYCKRLIESPQMLQRKIFIRFEGDIADEVLCFIVPCIASQKGPPFLKINIKVGESPEICDKIDVRQPRFERRGSWDFSEGRRKASFWPTFVKGKSLRTLCLNVFKLHVAVWSEESSVHERSCQNISEKEERMYLLLFCWQNVPRSITHIAWYVLNPVAHAHLLDNEQSKKSLWHLWRGIHPKASRRQNGSRNEERWESGAGASICAECEVLS